MASVAQAALRAWDVQYLAFECKGAKSEYKSLKHFWKQYENGAQITAYIRRTAHSGLTNSPRMFQHGADIQLFTVQKDKYPITAKQARELERLAGPSCGHPNCWHNWDNLGMTNV